jgi:hypothetical protein
METASFGASVLANCYAIAVVEFIVVVAVIPDLCNPAIGVFYWDV